MNSDLLLKKKKKEYDKPVSKMSYNNSLVTIINENTG